MSSRKVETDFNQENGQFILQLSKEDVGLGVEPVTYQGKTFDPKDEVHITLFGSGLGTELAELMDEDPKLAERLRAVIDGTDWSYELHDEWYHVVNGEEETIIRMAGVPRLGHFYRQVSIIAGVDIPRRPTHVTLYTFNNREGIGIATEEQFRERVVGELSPQYLEEEE